jgi:acid phosphatase
MTTLIPREAYSPEELQRLYPKELKLQLVQVVSLSDLYSQSEGAD